MSSSDIKDLVSSKLTQRSQENISLAREKCLHAKNLLRKYNSGKTDKELINQALELFNESIELYSKLIDAYTGVAYICYSLGKLKEAIGYLNTAKEIEPSNDEVNSMLATLLKEWEKQKISEVISKESGKSLSSAISERKKPKSSIMEMLSSLIFTTVVSKKFKNPGKQPAINSDQQANLPGNNTEKPVRGNFFDVINKAKSGMNNQ